MTGYRAEPCFLTAAEFAIQMRCVKLPANYEAVAVEEPTEPAQMARTLGRYALDSAATDASFVQCKAWIWARLTGKKRTVDVLFAKESPLFAPKAPDASFAHHSVGAMG